jgi:mannosyltransferase OCH1-like enzyme
MIDFWESMTASQVIPELSRNTEDWRKIKSAYDLAFNATVNQEAGQIPRRIHQIWLGKPLPKAYKDWCRSWKIWHPGWEYQLWTERDIAALRLENYDAFQNSPNFGVKSDIARYEILWRFGGIYVDTDFQCLTQFDPLIGKAHFIAGIMYGTKPAINNGLICSAAGHPILRAMIDHLRLPFDGHHGMDILAYSGPIQFTKVILSFLASNQDLLILPTSYFYPFPNTDVERETTESARGWIRPESLAIHYWETSWKKQALRTKLYWWLKKRQPAVASLVYRLLKGRPN